MELKNPPMSKTMFFSMTYHFLLDVAASVSVIIKYQILVLATLSRMLTCYMSKLSSGYDEKCITFSGYSDLFDTVKSYSFRMRKLYRASMFVNICLQSGHNFSFI